MRTTRDQLYTKTSRLRARIALDRGRLPRRSSSPAGRCLLRWRLASTLALFTVAVIAAAGPATADAGTYPMYQCGAGGTTAVAPGWSAYGTSTVSTTDLNDACATGGALGAYPFTPGYPGAATQSGSGGSGIHLAVNVPSSAPDVTIDSLTAQVIASRVTGDDAFLAFTSAGENLPGSTELLNGASGDYTTTETWTLPQAARNFEAQVYCSTDDSSPTCMFANSTAVPAFDDMTFTLSDNVPPAVDSISGPLATAAAADAAVTGTQTVGFDASDSDSGVRDATLTLTPQAGGTPTSTTVDYTCSYNSWNACPLSENGSSLEIDTTTVADGTYQVSLDASDAAGNTVTEQLGTIATRNAPTNTGTPASIGYASDVLVGDLLTADAGNWSAPTGAGTINYTYQWQACDANGTNCQPIAGATNATYTATSADVGETLRLAVTASDNDGSQTAASVATPLVRATPAPPLGSSPVTNGPSNTAPPSDGMQGPATGGTQAPTTPVANGAHATRNAILHLALGRVVNRPFTRRAFTLNGRLTARDGVAISEASLDILQQTAGTTGRALVIARARTTSNGRFTIHVPRGPSRLVEVAYRAFNNTPAYTVTATVEEHVAAGVTLSVAPTRTSQTGTITLTGRVNGQVPTSGVVVELLVHYLGHWEPFRSVRTGGSGSFRVAYKFEGARGEFPFRARVRSDQTDFPYTLGQSPTRDVTTP